MWVNVIKNIDRISKTGDSIYNLKVYQKYQNGFVIFDAELNFEHIYPLCLLCYHFSVLSKNKQF